MYALHSESILKYLRRVVSEEANDAGREFIPKGNKLKGLERRELMKTKGTFTKLTSLALLVATLTVYAASRAGAAIVSPTTASTAQTQVAPETRFVFGLIGLARGQSARLNAVLAIDPNDRTPLEVEFMFHDREGNVVASERQTLYPGHASSFEMHAVMLDIQPCISIRGQLGPETRNSIVGTLEVIDDSTGKTQFVLTNPRMIIDPNF